MHVIKNAFFLNWLPWLTTNGCRHGEHILGHYRAAKKCWLPRRRASRLLVLTTDWKGSFGSDWLNVPWVPIPFLTIWLETGSQNVQIRLALVMVMML